MGKRVQWLFLWLFAAAASVQAQPAPVTFSTNRTPSFSSSRLFHVAGGSSAVNLKLAAFADRVQAAVAVKLGESVPTFSRNPILLTLQKKEGSSSLIRRHQLYESRALYQEILIVNPDRADQEHVLEAITWCLLNRYGIVQQSTARREKNPVQCPEWLSTGLAQGLFPLSKNRNRLLLSRTFSKQPIHGSEEIFTWSRLPDQRPMTHAECQVQVDWLADEYPGFVSACVQQLAQEMSIGSEWVKDLCGFSSDRQLMMRRDVWLVRELVPYTEIGPYSAQDIRELQTLLNLEPPLLSLFFDPPTEKPDGLHELIRTLPESRSRETLRLLHRELSRLNAGKSGPLQTWTHSFAEFLRQLLSVEEALAADAMQRYLEQFQTLEKERRLLMAGWLDQDQYLDQFDLAP